MTDSQAKAIGVSSARKGRKRARDIVVRVTSYFLDSYTTAEAFSHRFTLEEDINKALLDVSHPARTYEKIDAFVDRIVSLAMLEKTKLFDVKI